MVYERMVWRQRERERVGGVGGGRGETDREDRVHERVGRRRVLLRSSFESIHEISVRHCVLPHHKAHMCEKAPI